MPSTSDRQAANAAIIAEYRANGGRITGAFADVPLLLLTTTGARSGESRTTPVGYTTDDARFVILASNGGRDTHPDWYRNLQVHPEAVVEVGTERFRAIATTAQEPEHSRLYAQLVAAIPVFAGFQPRTQRQIPIVILTRISPDGGQG